MSIIKRPLLIMQPDRHELVYVGAFDPDCDCMVDVRRFGWNDPVYIDRVFTRWSNYGLLARLVDESQFHPHQLSVSSLANLRCAEHRPVQTDGHDVRLTYPVRQWKAQVAKATRENKQLADSLMVLLEIAG